MQTANHIPFPPLIQSVDSWGPEQNQLQLTAQSEHLCLTPNNNHTDLWATRLKDQGRRDINTLGWVHELCPAAGNSRGKLRGRGGEGGSLPGTSKLNGPCPGCQQRLCGL